jgi:DNA repair exonuclease SbcCD ATPase subunit
MQEQQGGHRFRNIATAVVAVYVAVSLFFSYQMNNRIATLEQKQAQAEEKLGKKLSATEQQLKSTSEQMGQSQQELASRAAELQRQQKSTEAKLHQESEQRVAALGEVAGSLAGVRSDVGGVKTDVSATKTDLEATKAKLESLKGDLGVQSGLIATTREDLETLKHRGDRNYYEFTLVKSKNPTPISTVSLQLKKSDQKKGKFTLNVLADDKTIEKKDRTMNEPLQFYTGREHMLYELVVFEVSKDKVSGYLSTPKGAPVPMTK